MIIREMDHTGDTEHKFDIADPVSKAAAEKLFADFLEKRCLAVVPGKDGEPGKALRAFDETAEQIIVMPQMVGG